MRTDDEDARAAFELAAHSGASLDESPTSCSRSPLPRASGLRRGLQLAAR
jgi:hypothetical protein